MELPRLKYLISQYINKTITPAELEELNQHNFQSEEKQALLSEVLAEGLDNYQEPGFDSGPYEGLSAKVLMLDKGIDGTATVIRSVGFFRRWGWAAAVIVVLGTAAIIWNNNRQATQPVAVVDHALPLEVHPGGNKAELKLSDGTVITLDSASNGAIAREGNASIVKTSDGALVYDLKGQSAGTVMMNTMTTPNGGQYQLTLPDKTKVWLNAASSVSFPAVFVGTSRPVKISGEVYFEVAPDKEKPFIVDIDGQSKVQVLGTSFNVNAYRNENNISTTLLSGSIKVLQDAGNSATLQPGQQALQSKNTKLQVQSADVNQVMAWKNGYFSFENAGLRQMARQLERWYDISIEFQGTVPDIALKGEMDRGVKLTDVIRFLDDYGLKASLQGRVLTLSTK